MKPETVARTQMKYNKPGLKSGQRWTAIEGEDSPYPRELRIVCRYPFSKPNEGRLWIVESSMSYMNLDRIPELTLRQLYSLSEDVE